MGEVYLAQHPRLPRQDALKVLSADVSADADYRARFNREADLASTLWHPHIVGVHDRGEEDGQLWISMDFVDGLDAARLLANRYTAGMPVEEVARIVTAVASALDYAHKQGLLHRDTKPANIMLTHLDDEGEQRILLTDFGIARNVNDISGLTKTNMTVGTVAYSSPEQLLGEDIDGRADQYSLAATAYHLLTGSQLFPHSNPAVVISRHLNSPPPTLAEKRPELVNLDPVLATGLAKHPEDRYQRCSDFARALSQQINSASPPTQAAPVSPAPVQAMERAGNRVTAQPRTLKAESLAPATPAPPKPPLPVPTTGGGIGRRATVAIIVGAVVLVIVVAVAIYATFGHASSRTSQTPTAQPGPSTPQPVPSSASSSATPSPSATAEPTDYSGLLIHATDIDAPIRFTGSPPISNPNGRSGVATSFGSDDGSRVIQDTIQVLGDPIAATNALQAAQGKQARVLKDPITQPSNVGTDGTLMHGNSADGSKGVTVLLFTESTAFVTLQFVGPPDTLAPPDFVTDLGQKQDVAVKKGLGG
jgi:serine/threonine-protein kinase